MSDDDKALGAQPPDLDAERERAEFLVRLEMMRNLALQVISQRNTIETRIAVLSSRIEEAIRRIEALEKASREAPSPK